MASTRDKLRREPPHIAEQAFDLMDDDDDGYMTRSEVAGLFRFFQEPDIQTATSALYAQYDKGADGRISKQEYFAWIGIDRP